MVNYKWLQLINTISAKKTPSCYIQSVYCAAVLANLREGLKVCWSIRSRDQPLHLLPQKPDLCWLSLPASGNFLEQTASAQQCDPKEKRGKINVPRFSDKTESMPTLAFNPIFHKHTINWDMEKYGVVLSLARFCHISLDLSTQSPSNNLISPTIDYHYFFFFFLSFSNFVPTLEYKM